MEAADRRIIELLRGDGRMSYTDLGKAVGLSTSAVHQRVRRLEERGVITGYAATIDPTALGTPLTAFVSVAPLDPRDPDDIPERLRDIQARLGVRSLGEAADQRLLDATLSLLRDRRTLRFDGADSFQDATDASVRYLARGPWQVDALAYLQARNFSNVVISSTTFRPSGNCL